MVMTLPRSVLGVKEMQWKITCPGSLWECNTLVFHHCISRMDSKACSDCRNFILVFREIPQLKGFVSDVRRVRTPTQKDALVPYGYYILAYFESLF